MYMTFSLMPYYHIAAEILRDCYSNGPEYHPKRTKLKGYQKCKRRK